MVKTVELRSQLQNNLKIHVRYMDCLHHDCLLRSLLYVYIYIYIYVSIVRYFLFCLYIYMHMIYDSTSFRPEILDLNGFLVIGGCFSGFSYHSPNRFGSRGGGFDPGPFRTVFGEGQSLFLL